MVAWPRVAPVFSDAVASWSTLPPSLESPLVELQGSPEPEAPAAPGLTETAASPPDAGSNPATRSRMRLRRTCMRFTAPRSG